MAWNQNKFLYIDNFKNTIKADHILEIPWLGFSWLLFHYLTCEIIRFTNDCSNIFQEDDICNIFQEDDILFSTCQDMLSCLVVHLVPKSKLHSTN